MTVGNRIETIGVRPLIPNTQRQGSKKPAALTAQQAGDNTTYRSLYDKLGISLR